MNKKSSEKAAGDWLRERLRATEPPADGELRGDLWPRMLERIAEASRGRELRPSPVRVPWFDWALIGLAAAALLFFPALVPALLYHF